MKKLLKISNKKYLLNTIIITSLYYVAIMQMITHINVVQLKEVLASKSKIYVILEYIQGGNFADYIGYLLTQPKRNHPSQNRRRNKYTNSYYLLLNTATT